MNTIPIKTADFFRTADNRNVVHNKTTIMATEQNINFLKIFFEANNLFPRLDMSEHRIVLESSVDPRSENLFTETYYNAISIDYAIEDDDIEIILLNLSAKHNGLENMLIDYLLKVKASPILMKYTPMPKTTDKDVTENFITKVAPKLKAPQSSKIKIKKEYAKN